MLIVSFAPFESSRVCSCNKVPFTCEITVEPEFFASSNRAASVALIEPVAVAVIVMLVAALSAALSPDVIDTASDWLML